MRPNIALRLVVLPLVALVAASLARAQAARPAPAVPRQVSEIQLAFDVERGVAGGGAILRVLLRDAAGPVDAPVRVLADGGEIDEPVRAGPGAFTVRVAVAPVLGAKRALLVIAAAGNLTASATLPLAPGPPALLRVEPPADLAADGAAHPLWVTVVDAHGNLSPEVPRAEALRGSVSDPVSLASGGWMLRYRPPRDTRRSEDVLRLSAGPATSSATLALRPMVPTLSIGARGGAVVGTSRAAPAFGAEATTWLEAWSLELGVSLGAAWWTRESRGSVRVAGGDLELRSRRAWVPLTATAALRHSLGGRVAATFSAGGGAALVTSRTTLADQPTVAEAGWAPAAAAGLEIALRQRVGEVFVGAHGWWIGDAALETVRGAAWPIFLHLGYRFHAY